MAESLTNASTTAATALWARVASSDVSDLRGTVRRRAPARVLTHSMACRLHPEAVVSGKLLSLNSLGADGKVDVATWDIRERARIVRETLNLVVLEGFHQVGPAKSRSKTATRRRSVASLPPTASSGSGRS